MPKEESQYSSADEGDPRVDLYPIVYRTLTSKEQDRTAEKKENFLEQHIRCGRCISRTCQMIGISRWTFYNWIRRDWIFAHRVKALEGRTAFRKEMFAEVYGKIAHKGIAGVCRIVGISRWTYYSWRRKDREFVKLKDAEFHADLKGEMGPVESKWLKTHTT